MYMEMLAETQRCLIEEIKKKGKEINPTVGPIWDGVADIQAYLHSSPKVAWILKEPYDIEPSKEGWSHPDLLSKLTLVDIDSKLTWRRVNETMFAIRNHCLFNEETLIDANYLKDIAWLNLSKMPGASISDGSYKRDYHRYWSGILKKQVEAYNPEILIFGNTFDICKKELFPNGIELKKKNPLVHVYTSEGRLILFSFHPGYWGVDDASYVNSIMKEIHENNTGL